MTRVLIPHDTVTVKINVVHSDALLPEHKTDLCAGFDLAPIDPVKLYPGESGLFRTGLIIQPPIGHMLLLAPRSSTWKRYGLKLANTVGILDEDYCGPEDEVKLYLHNASKGFVVVEPGTRLAQGIFVPITRAAFEVVDGPIAKTRGGWGSTGV